MRVVCIPVGPAVANRNPAGHGEIAGQLGVPLIEAEPLGLATEHLHVIEHVVVECKIADRDEIEAGIALYCPVTSAQFARNRFELRCVHFTAPVLFQGEFQFALRTDAWETENMRTNHDGFSSAE